MNFHFFIVLINTFRRILLVEAQDTTYKNTFGHTLFFLLYLIKFIYGFYKHTEFFKEILLLFIFNVLKLELSFSIS